MLVRSPSAGTTTLAIVITDSGSNFAARPFRVAGAQTISVTRLVGGAANSLEVEVTRPSFSTGLAVPVPK